jgi:chromosome segregation ATPase
MVQERLRLVMLSVVLLGATDAVQVSSVANGDVLDQTGKLAGSFEKIEADIEAILKRASSGEGSHKSALKGLTEKIDDLASQIAEPFMVPEGTKVEVKEEFTQLRERIGNILPSLRTVVQSVDDAAEDTVNKVRVPQAKWDELWTEVKSVRGGVNSYLTNLLGYDQQNSEVKAMFSWNWEDSHIPGLRWIQKSLDIEIWRPVPDAETLQQELEKKVKSDRQKYGERDLKIRIERTGEIVFKTNPATAITWLDEFKGKQDL